jgi:hypothetical protein
VWRTLPIAAILVLVLSGGFYAWPMWLERQALASLPPAGAAKPNVLLIVLDTVRAKSMSLYGYQRATTPNLDRFAARGVVFDDAMVSAPWTLASHGTMFTGRYPYELSVDFLNGLDAKHPTISEALRREGYLTAGFHGELLVTAASSSGCRAGSTTMKATRPRSWPRSSRRDLAAAVVKFLAWAIDLS